MSENEVNDQKPSWYLETEELLSDPVFTHLEWNGRTTDWFLQEKVRQVNEGNVDIGITISTPAGWITGQLISTKEYFKLYAEAYSATFVEESRQEVRDAIASYGNMPEPIEGQSMAPYQYIHLKNAKLCTPSGFTPNDPGVLWRGTIASVSGFSLGQLIPV